MRLFVLVLLLAPVQVLCEPPPEGDANLPKDKQEKIEHVKSVICKEGVLASLVKDVWAKMKPVKEVETRTLDPKKIRLAFGILARLFRLCDESLEGKPAPINLKLIPAEKLELPLPDDVIPRLCEVKDLHTLLKGIAEKLKEKLPETKRKLPPIFRALNVLGEIYKENCPVIAQRSEDEPEMPKPEIKEEIKMILCDEVISKLVEQLKGLVGAEGGFVEIAERKFTQGQIKPIHPMKIIPRLIKAHSKICIEKEDDPTVVAMLLRMLEEREVKGAGKGKGGKGAVKGPENVKVILEGISEDLLKGLKATVCVEDVKNLLASLKAEEEDITAEPMEEKRAKIAPQRPSRVPLPPPRIILKRFGRLVEVLCETEVPAEKTEKRQTGIPTPDPEVKALVCEGEIPALMDNIVTDLLDMLHSTEEDEDEELIPEVPQGKGGPGKGGKRIRPNILPKQIAVIFGLLRHQQQICRIKEDEEPGIPLKEIFKQLKHAFREEMEAGDEEPSGLLEEMLAVLVERVCSEEADVFFKGLIETLAKLNVTMNQTEKEKIVAGQGKGKVIKAPVIKAPIIFIKKLVYFRTNLCKDVEARGAPDVTPPKPKTPGNPALISALERLLSEE